MVKTVKEDRFDDIKESKVAVADFSATWCGPCKMMAPVFHAVADEMGDEVDFYSVDVDENPGLAAAVRQVLDINKQERHIRGGMATREKYLHQQN